ncbi:MAG: aminoacyl-tRNA hydrolase [Clostridia bacterium]|nr:aminoacyl-tRNA hydrolase [Clostridia bacterium]
MSKETFIVVGLGNPGDKYAHTRHNVGFDVTEKLEKQLNITLNKAKFSGMLTETDVDGNRLVICRPQTFMNLSGDCVGQLLSWYKVPLDHLMVIYDDIDLPAGKLRIRKSGSAGTHNGMRSIIANVPGQDFPRIRVGVGKCPEDWQLVDWVLSRYRTREEQQDMDHAFDLAADCVLDWIRSGIEHAMQTYNGKK